MDGWASRPRSLVLLGSRALPVTGDPHSRSGLAPRVRRGCLVHVVQTTWLRHPCTLVRCWSGECDGSPFPLHAATDSEARAVRSIGPAVGALAGRSSWRAGRVRGVAHAAASRLRSACLAAGPPT